MFYRVAQGAGYKYKRFSLEPDEKEHADNSRDKPKDIGITYCLYEIRDRQTAPIKADIHGENGEDQCN